MSAALLAILHSQAGLAIAAASTLKLNAARTVCGKAGASAAGTLDALQGRIKERK
jgi:hypothetical protein